jgi:hypothetical protein
MGKIRTEFFVQGDVIAGQPVLAAVTWLINARPSLGLRLTPFFSVSVLDLNQRHPRLQKLQ